MSWTFADDFMVGALHVSDAGSLFVAMTDGVERDCRMAMEKYDARGQPSWRWQQRGHVVGCHGFVALVVDDEVPHVVALSPRANHPRTLTIYRVDAPVFGGSFE